MEPIKKITGEFKVIQSTSSKLIGYHIKSGAIVGQDVELYKDLEHKELSVDFIIKVDYEKYHILNSNISVIVKRI